jgi:LemA protein
VGRPVFRGRNDARLAKRQTRPHVGSAALKIQHWRKLMKRLPVLALLLVSMLSLGGCGYNTLQSSDEQVKAAWSEVVNQYQRRADLVPNLVNTVKGFAQQEKDVLLGVTNARAKVGTVQPTPELVNDPAAFQKFQAAQGELTSALSRLLVVAENYPQLKSDQNFRDLQAQLEGTENRIAVARNRYIKAVQEFNVTVRSFPQNLTAMMFGFKPKAQFTVDNEKEISSAPKVDFGSSPAPAPAKPAIPPSPPSEYSK